MRLNNKALVLAILVMMGCYATDCLAATQKTVTGDNPWEVQENAYKQGFEYPVGPLRCSQRCSQRWERQ